MNHFLDICDFDRDQLMDLLIKARGLRDERVQGQSRNTLTGRMIGLLFEKPSNRTRVSFEVGVSELGGDRLVLKSDDVGLGKREPLQDIVRVFSRYLDALVIRTFSHDTIRTLVDYSDIPIINALTDHSHPCQALADFMTIWDHFGQLEGQKICYLGDGNNVCRSLVELAHILGVSITVSSPKGFALSGFDAVEQIEDPVAAIRDASVVYTDTWVSMGEEDSGKSMDVFWPYQVNEAMMAHARSDAIFLHCLPAHRGEEVTDQVLESVQSKVFDQAENRLHVQKAVLDTLFS